MDVRQRAVVAWCIEQSTLGIENVNDSAFAEFAFLPFDAQTLLGLLHGFAQRLDSFRRGTEIQKMRICIVASS